MAKKDKIGLIPDDNAAVHPPGGVVVSQSSPAGQTAPANRDGVKTPGQAASPTQMENTMVQQILERQAVFGF